jgi:hypothetical protein
LSNCFLSLVTCTYNVVLQSLTGHPWTFGVLLCIVLWGKQKSWCAYIQGKHYSLQIAVQKFKYTILHLICLLLVVHSEFVYVLEISDDTCYLYMTSVICILLALYCDLMHFTLLVCSCILLHYKVWRSRLDNCINVVSWTGQWLPHCMPPNRGTKRVQG